MAPTLLKLRHRIVRIHRGKHLSCPVAVVVHLADEGFGTFEGLVRADEVDQFDGDLAAVEVLVEVEQIDFQLGDAVIEGGAAAIVGSGIEAAAVDLLRGRHRCRDAGSGRATA